MSTMEPRCMGCMTPLTGEESACPHCGFPANGDNPPPYLPVKTELSGRYIVGRMVEVGGGTVLYAGYDRELQSVIQIREFFPDTLCERDGGTVVAVRGGCDIAYADYIQTFLRHARGLARMRDLPCILPIYDIFEENNTAYVIGDACEGVSLQKRLQKPGSRVRWEDVRPMIMSLLATLMRLHAAGIYHLGISPASLIVGRDGKLHLTDFFIPQARVVGGDIKPQLNAGYAAPEQYVFGQLCGAATDVYGMAATLFHLLTGVTIPDGATRAASAENAELLVPVEVAKTLPVQVKTALIKALQISPEQRTPTIERLRDELSAEPAVAALRKDAPTAAVRVPVAAPPPKKKRRWYAVAIVVGVFVVLLGVGAGVLAMLFPGMFGLSSVETPSGASSAPPQSAQSDPSADVSLTNPYVVDSLLGKNYYQLRQEGKLTGAVIIELEGRGYSTTYKRGEIMSQDPAPGAEVEKGSVVKVFVSLGPEEQALPDLAGWKQEHAVAYLEALGYVVNIRPVEVSLYDKGYVQETSPGYNSVLREGDTVTLVVSNVTQPTQPPSEETSSPGTEGSQRSG